MEGYLLKWVNPFQRWQKRYFILNDNILTYCDQPGGRSKGQIHLKVAGINESKDDTLRIIINTGTGQILLKAANIDEKNKWLIALKKNQEYCQRHQVFNYGQRIQELLTDIWSNFALFDEQLTYLQEKATLSMYKEISNIIDIGQYLKNGITLCCTLIEEEKIKLYGESDTIYESFDFENEIPLNTQTSNYTIRQEEYKQNQLENMNSHQFLETIKLLNPIKYNNIKYNRVYSRLSITNEATRKCLPYKQDPDEKFAFWPFLKECIGKDLTRIPMPLLFHQPLSALQFFAASFEYYDTLKQAAKAEDPYKRMAYLIVFSLVRCILGIDCQKKFFNPVLGETYEYFTPEYKVISEQVCHHPPITAVHCESEDFILSITMEATVGFSGTSIKAKLPGLVHFRNKKTNEHMTYSFPSIAVKNLLFGKMYFEQVGEAIYTNHTTGDVGILTLKERTSEKDAHQVKAIIKDRNGNIRCQLSGYFNKEIYANNELIWKRNYVDPESRWYYFYSHHILQLNHINEEILRNIPQTDSRMRSDMRALECGFKDLGQEEKVRIEEKQRERRKIMEEKKQQHIPRFFKEEYDSFSKRNQWVYLYNYEKEKHLIDLDLF
ncbi:unnamed protein product [Paramecium pentaurelia]|uniref:PH domain-containing protein n=1 Tax=Paramecium pentaurelia TaxID=43138 RepID=A0A8S1RXK9_9CILI|nr:unnamed protein product [Paramecium pentaurelia]